MPATLPQRFDFLLLPRFPLVALVNAIEPLRIANRILGRDAYAYRTCSATGAPVAASNDLQVPCDYALGAGIQSIPQALLVCAGFEHERWADRRMLEWLRRLARNGVVMGALDSGAYVLALAGLLENCRVCVHWESATGFRERFPGIDLSDSLYEHDGERLTCAGGSAVADMMLNLIGNRHGGELAVAVAEQLVHERVRTGSERQRMGLAARVGVQNRTVLRAVECMEANLENTLDGARLAERAGVSRRQLERLFRRHLNDTPSGFYLRLRLQRAREMLQNTSLGVLDIATACGFGSAPHFSRVYRTRYGRPPVQDRKLWPR